ncbi:hypothetical protein GGE45_006051 [Rhizobium aethiopicum]|uniref:Uncharacterized protein n=1 Tax=Rhizobium aethiopicum TaxID=1138170 RepID=A0A7W6QEA6_9HYPH|nr:hypothetical protein [Rhizobium aethiopicum]MBB4583677.1 hypothetical protein [Rhizobium aethiopicum]
MDARGKSAVGRQFTCEPQLDVKGDQP